MNVAHVAAASSPTVPPSVNPAAVTCTDAAVTVAGLIGSEKQTCTTAPAATFVAPFAGATVLTVGPVVSLAPPVVNRAVTGASAMPAPSRTPATLTR